MASSNDNVSMALFCDFENVALGVRDANYDKFDIKPVLERLLLKGSIVVKKAYCDWDRYKGFKAPMHEANFELIEIPHVRQSGKNSADIRMVVDALDLCYTKSHVDTFVIISGDSDFSPLVSKLRENAKKVIGVGVKQSTSDLLVANCDEFIFYDDLVRESRRAKRESSNETKPAVKRSPEEERARREEMDKRRNQAVEIAANTFEALVSERGDSGKIWASVLKEAIKRRKPDFSESYYGFRTFGNLIEECKARGLLEFGRDEKSGAYVYRGTGVPTPGLQGGESSSADGAQGDGQDGGKQESRRSRGRGRTAAERFAERQAERLAQQARAAQADGDADDAEPAVHAYVEPEQLAGQPDAPEALVVPEAAPAAESDRGRGRGRGNRGGRKQGERQGQQDVAAEAPVAVEAVVEVPVVAEETPAKKKSGQKPPARKLKEAAKPKAEEAAAKGGKGAKNVRGGKSAAAKGEQSPPAAAPAPAPAPVAAAVEAAPAAASAPADAAPAAKPAKAKPAAKPARKPAAARTPRPAKAAAAKAEE
ncbi:NYN domain-containing protein [Duganella sp. HH105]|uniref:NYN domain-containing protein n=1 Tax=Duganella sp. HH105 TaxID=1781067 RepID=UPI000877DAEE|nr:NYN domain-containing protein [Duganella sp. HH105]OEZ56484.1 NYN domain protein [Duganella sp. HH105]